MKSFLLFFLLPLAAIAIPDPKHPVGENSRARELKEIINKEKPQFEARERNRKDLLSQLDHLNAEQNQVRQRLLDISSSQGEMTMALDNLEIELTKQQEMEKLQKQRLLLLLKVVY